MIHDENEDDDDDDEDEGATARRRETRRKRGQVENCAVKVRRSGKGERPKVRRGQREAKGGSETATRANDANEAESQRHGDDTAHDTRQQHTKHGQTLFF